MTDVFFKLNCRFIEFTLLQLLQHNVHLGVSDTFCLLSSHWFLLGVRHKFTIINLRFPVVYHRQFLVIANSAVKKRKRVLFVNERSHLRAFMQKATFSVGEVCMVGPWIAGLLTNFKSIWFAQYSKKISSGINPFRFFYPQRQTLVNSLQGLLSLLSVPGTVFFNSLKQSLVGVREAAAMGLPSGAILDSDMIPAQGWLAIPGNDDSIGSIFAFNELVAKTVLVAKLRLVTRFGWKLYLNSVRVRGRLRNRKFKFFKNLYCRRFFAQVKLKQFSDLLQGYWTTSQFLKFDMSRRVSFLYFLNLRSRYLVHKLISAYFYIKNLSSIDDSNIDWRDFYSLIRLKRKKRKFLTLSFFRWYLKRFVLNKFSSNSLSDDVVLNFKKKISGYEVKNFFSLKRSYSLNTISFNIKRKFFIRNCRFNYKGDSRFGLLIKKYSVFFTLRDLYSSFKTFFYVLKEEWINNIKVVKKFQLFLKSLKILYYLYNKVVSSCFLLHNKTMLKSRNSTIYNGEISKMIIFLKKKHVFFLKKWSFYLKKFCLRKNFISGYSFKSSLAFVNSTITGDLYKGATLTFKSLSTGLNSFLDFSVGIPNKLTFLYFNKLHTELRSSLVNFKKVVFRFKNFDKNFVDYKLFKKKKNRIRKFLNLRFLRKSSLRTSSMYNHLFGYNRVFNLLSTLLRHKYKKSGQYAVSSVNWMVNKKWLYRIAKKNSFLLKNVIIQKFFRIFKRNRIKYRRPDVKFFIKLLQLIRFMRFFKLFKRMLTFRKLRLSFYRHNKFKLFYFKPWFFFLRANFRRLTWLKRSWKRRKSRSFFVRLFRKNRRLLMSWRRRGRKRIWRKGLFFRRVRKNRNRLRARWLNVVNSKTVLFGNRIICKTGGVIPLFSKHRRILSYSSLKNRKLARFPSFIGVKRYLKLRRYNDLMSKQRYLSQQTVLLRPLHRKRKNSRGLLRRLAMLHDL